MRHRRRRGKLGVKTHHRKALLRNLVRNLVIRKRIRTTLVKAKEAAMFADQMVHLAKSGDNLHARRLLIARLGCPDTARTLITQIAPHFKDRKGGYTRVLHLGTRRGDGAETALLEFTATIALPEKLKKQKKEKKTVPAKHEEPASEKPKKKDAESKQPEVKKEEKKESEKKGGFLSALRKFLKGDEESK